VRATELASAGAVIPQKLPREPTPQLLVTAAPGKLNATVILVAL